MPAKLKVNGRDQAEQDKKQAKRQAKTALAEINEALDDLTDQWDGLNQAAKLQAVRRGVIISLRAAKWLASR